MGEQTLGAIDWQNQELDKQNKAIEEAGSQIGETASRIQKTRSQISESASKINETLKESTKKTQDIAPVFVDTITANILHLMVAQTNPQLKLKDLPTRRYKKNGIIITLEKGAFLFKDNTYEFSDGFFNFLTKPNITYDDKIEEDENKVKRILLDIRFDLVKGDKKSSRYRTIKRILGVKDDVFGKGLNSFDICGWVPRLTQIT